MNVHIFFSNSEIDGVFYRFFLDLLERVLAAVNGNKDENDSTPTDGGSARRRTTAGKSPSRNEEKSEPDYTSEQLEHVKRVKR